MAGRRGRFGTAWLIVVSVAVGVGALLPRFNGDRSAAEQSAAAVPVTLVTVGEDAGEPAAPRSEPLDMVVVAAPAGATWGVPVGYPQSPAGVRAAAVGWVAALGDLIRMGPVARQDTLAAMLSERAYTETITSFRAERERFQAQFGRDVSEAVWIDSPLMVEILSAEDERAVVAVWSALHFGTVTDRLEVMWRTHHITLVWERDSWRVDDVVRRDGPAPLTAAGSIASPGADFVAVVDWRPAVLAGTSVG